MCKRTKKYSNSIVAVEDKEARKNYVMENYSRLEQEYGKFKKRYNYYHSVKEILEVGFILLGRLATVFPGILSLSNFSNNTTSHIISSIVAIPTLITVSISKILNRKLIQNTKNKMVNRNEVSDKLFNYYTKPMVDNEIFH